MNNIVRKTKKVLASLLSLAIILSHFPGLSASAAEVEENRVIYSLATDTLFQNWAIGSTGNQVLNTPHLNPSGSPTFTIVENPNGGNSIQVSNRTANWNTLDLQRVPLDLEVGNLYTITVSGRMEAPFDTFVIAGPTSPFGWIGNATPNENGEFTVTATLNYERLEHPQFANAFRLQGQNNSAFIIDEIIVRYVGPDPDWTPPIYVPTPAPYGDVLRVAGEGVALPVAALDIEAGNVYEILVDLHVPSVTATDVEISLLAGDDVILESGVFRAHPGFHDPTFEGPMWRRYIGELDLSGLTAIDFEALTLVATPAGSTRNLVYRVDNFTILRNNVVVHEFDFEDSYEPFVALGDGSISTAPNVDTRVWHDINFGDDWATYQNNVQSHNEDIMIGERVDTRGNGDGYSFRLSNAPNTTFTNSQNRSMRLDLTTPIPVGAHVTVSWDVFVPSVGNEGVTQSAMIAPGVVVNRFVGSPELQPTNSIPAPGDLNRRIAWDQWVNTETHFEVTAFTEPVESLFFRFRADAASGNNQPHVVYIDNVVITVTIADEPYIPTWETKASLPSLAEIYADYFLVGQILEPPLFNDEPLMNAFFHHYNSVTAENAMKPDTISGGASLATRPDTLNLTNARAFVDLAEANDLHIVGHTLVWHEQSSIWMHGDAVNGFHTREEAMENLRWFIREYAGYFEGRIDAWDVTNEVVTSGGGDEPAGSYTAIGHPTPQAGSWQRRIRANVPWFRAFSNGADFAAGERGWDYIYYSFVFARYYAPDALLIYNDFNEETPGKRDAIAGMVEYFNERWANDAVNNPAYGDPTHPDYGRLLIEVIGMQAHYNNNTNINNVRAAIERFAETGARIHVTELDIHFNTPMAGQAGWMTQAQLAQQTDMYAQLFRWYVEFADYIDRVTFWGRDDMSSWRSAGAPTLFDRNLNPKPSFFAVVDPFAHIGEPWPGCPIEIYDITRLSIAGIEGAIDQEERTITFNVPEDMIYHHEVLGAQLRGPIIELEAISNTLIFYVGGQDWSLMLGGIAGVYTGDTVRVEGGIVYTIVIVHPPSICEVIAYGQFANQAGVDGLVGSEWRLCEDGTLEIDEGFISWNLYQGPWAAYVDEITAVVITGPVTAGTSLRSLFRDFQVTEIEGLTYFDTTRTRNMENMFRNTTELVELDLSSFNTANVTNMQRMFTNMRALRELTLGEGFAFIDNAGLPNLSHGTEYTGMWQNDEFVFTSAQLMNQFDGATMAGTFAWQVWENDDVCEIIASGRFAHQAIAESGVAGAAWRLCEDGTLEIDEGFINWTLYNGPWHNYRNDITHIVITGPITAGPSLRSLFRDLNYVTEIEGLTHFDTTLTTSMQYMFRTSTGITELDLSSFDSSNVTNMHRMFTNMHALEYVDFGENFIPADNSGLPAHLRP